MQWLRRPHFHLAEEYPVLLQRRAIGLKRPSRFRRLRAACHVVLRPGTATQKVWTGSKGGPEEVGAYGIASELERRSGRFLECAKDRALTGGTQSRTVRSDGQAWGRLGHARGRSRVLRDVRLRAKIARLQGDARWIVSPGFEHTHVIGSLESRWVRDVDLTHTSLHLLD